MKDFSCSRPSFHSSHNSLLCLIDFIDGFKSYSSCFCVKSSIFSISDCITVCAIERGSYNEEVKSTSLKNWSKALLNKSDICICLISSKWAKKVNKSLLVLLMLQSIQYIKDIVRVYSIEPNNLHLFKCIELLHDPLFPCVFQKNNFSKNFVQKFKGIREEEAFFIYLQIDWVFSFSFQRLDTFCKFLLFKLRFEKNFIRGDWQIREKNL